MTDALEVAKARKAEYKAEIAKKKSEIEELEEMIGDLDSFVEFGQELIGGQPKIVTPKSKPSPQIKEAPNAPAAKAVPSDEWSEENATDSISRVLSARQG